MEDVVLLVRGVVEECSAIISEVGGMGPGVYGDDNACDASPRSADFVLAGNIYGNGRSRGQNGRNGMGTLPRSGSMRGV